MNSTNLKKGSSLESLVESSVSNSQLIGLFRVVRPDFMV
jgi:hypothetical protein